jgi:hypothetical protein
LVNSILPQNGSGTIPSFAAFRNTTDRWQWTLATISLVVTLSVTLAIEFILALFKFIAIQDGQPTDHPDKPLLEMLSAFAFVKEIFHHHFHPSFV